MPIALRETRLTARKQHRCSLCCGWIAPGDTYLNAALVDWDHVYTWKQCAECDGIFNAAYEYTGWDADGVTAEDAYEWAREMCSDPQWGEAARAFLRRNHEGRTDVTP